MALIEGWKNQLADKLIEYDTLTVEETIAAKGNVNQILSTHIYVTT